MPSQVNLSAAFSLLAATAAAAQHSQLEWSAGPGIHGSDRGGPCAPEWADWFPSADLDQARDLLAWDPDGPGPEPTSLYAAGWFTTASGVPIYRAARFDGLRWWPLGVGFGNTDPFGPSEGAWAMRPFDPDGDGPAPSVLVVAGRFATAGGQPAANIAAWDGAHWSGLGAGLDDEVAELEVYDPDGPGPASPLLISAGEFTHADGVAASGIAAWDGQAWHPLGAGLTPAPEVVSLTVHDADGAGPGAPVLVAGGHFGHAGGNPVNGVAAWDGSQWQSLGNPALNSVSTVRSLDLDADGPQLPTLLAGGETTPLQPAIAELNDAGWHVIAQFWGYFEPLGAWPWIDDMAVFDPDGAGPDPGGLYAAGVFAPGEKQGYWGAARLLDGAWQVVDPTYSGDGAQYRLVPADPDGPGPEPSSLYMVRDKVRRLGLNGPEPLRPFYYGSLRAATVFDADGPGPRHPALYVGGNFSYNGQPPLSALAVWDGQAWSSAGAGISGGSVDNFALFDDHDGGASPDLYVGGSFGEAGGFIVNSIARWDGSQWSALGAGLETVDDYAQAATLLVCDPDADGPLPRSLIVGGYFDRAGGQTAASIAAWDGSQWHALGDGLQGGYDGRGIVYRLALFDEDGDGPKPARLFAGGDFRKSGPDYVWYIAAFDGQKWVEVGGGMNGPVLDLVVFDPDADGPEAAMLLAAGEFSKAGGIKAPGLARWDGATWSADGLLGGANDLTIIDEDGVGPANAVLYVSGSLGKTPWDDDAGLARWDGHTWSPPPAAFYGGYYYNLDAVWFDEGSLGAPGLYYFPTTGVNEISSTPFARFGCPPDSACYGDCTADGSLDFFDFVCFINLFNTADPAADCDASGELDLFDFLCFVNAFNAGC